ERTVEQRNHAVRLVRLEIRGEQRRIGRTEQQVDHGGIETARQRNQVDQQAALVGMEGHGLAAVLVEIVGADETGEASAAVVIEAHLLAGLVAARMVAEVEQVELRAVGVEGFGGVEPAQAGDRVQRPVVVEAEAAQRGEAVDLAPDAQRAALVEIGIAEHIRRTVPVRQQAAEIRARRGVELVIRDDVDAALVAGLHVQAGADRPRVLAVEPTAGKVADVAIVRAVVNRHAPIHVGAERGIEEAGKHAAAVVAELGGEAAGRGVAGLVRDQRERAALRAAAEQRACGPRSTSMRSMSYKATIEPTARLMSTPSWNTDTRPGVFDAVSSEVMPRIAMPGVFGLCTCTCTPGV